MISRQISSIEKLPPGSFSFVMATGIISTALYIFHQNFLSWLLLAISLIGYFVLLILYVLKIIKFRERFVQDGRSPGKSFGYFTIIAATNVLAARLILAHFANFAMILWVISLPMWLILTYLIPGVLILESRQESILKYVDGSWYLWVVATASVAVAAAVLTAPYHNLAQFLSVIAVSFWSIGVVLYLMLLGLATFKLLDAPVTIQGLAPTYWITMGATAILTLAGSRILIMPLSVSILSPTKEVVSGITFMLWSYGTWWIPMLIVFGIWRHLIKKQPVAYEAGLWSMIFPLGMYATASELFGDATHLDFMKTIASYEIWFGLLVWVISFFAMLFRAGKFQFSKSN